MWLAIAFQVGVVEECQMACAKIHGRGDAELEIGVDAEFPARYLAGAYPRVRQNRIGASPDKDGS